MIERTGPFTCCFRCGDRLRASAGDRTCSRCGTAYDDATRVWFTQQPALPRLVAWLPLFNLCVAIPITWTVAAILSRGDADRLMEHLHWLVVGYGSVLGSIHAISTRGRSAHGYVAANPTGVLVSPSGNRREVTVFTWEDVRRADRFICVRAFVLDRIGTLMDSRAAAERVNLEAVVDGISARLMTAASPLIATATPSGTALAST